jgi:hypothetical protein
VRLLSFGSALLVASIEGEETAVECDELIEEYNRASKERTNTGESELPGTAS